MKKLLIYIGCPGSGKSFAARELLNQDKTFKRINKDELRKMCDNSVYSPENEAIIQKISENLCKQFLTQGFNVVVDNTNLRAKTRKRYHEIAAKIGDIEVIEQVFNVPLEACLLQNKQRAEQVPEDVIRDMFRRFKLPQGNTVYYPKITTELEKYIPDPDLQKALVCDLDGSLALHNGRDPYDAARCEEDLLNENLAWLLGLVKDHAVRIIFLSGRSEEFRPQTQRWLNKQELNEHKFGSYLLYMRPQNDKRSDEIVKRELFDKHIRPYYNVMGIWDDRARVCRVWYKLGLNLYRVGDPDADF